MVIKVLGSILVIGSTSLFGFLLGRERVNRLSQLKELKQSFLLLRGEIEYGFTPLPEAMENLGMKNDTVFSGFFISVSKKLNTYEGRTFYEIWKEEIKEKLGQTSLSKEDKKKLLAMGETLGYLDQKMQQSTINFYLDSLGEEIKREGESQGEKIRIFQLLGVLSGVFVTIVML